MQNFSVYHYMKILALLIKINKVIEKVCSFPFYPNLLNGSIDFTVSPAKKSSLYTLHLFVLEAFNKELTNTSQKIA